MKFSAEKAKWKERKKRKAVSTHAKDTSCREEEQVSITVVIGFFFLYLLLFVLTHLASKIELGKELWHGQIDQGTLLTRRRQPYKMKCTCVCKCKGKARNEKLFEKETSKRRGAQMEKEILESDSRWSKCSNPK